MTRLLILQLCNWGGIESHYRPVRKKKVSWKLPNIRFSQLPCLLETIFALATFPERLDLKRMAEMGERCTLSPIITELILCPFEGIYQKWMGQTIFIGQILLAWFMRNKRQWQAALGNHDQTYKTPKSAPFLNLSKCHNTMSVYFFVTGERKISNWYTTKKFVSFTTTQQRWYNGIMFACHADDPGSTPGRCKYFLLLCLRFIFFNFFFSHSIFWWVLA